MQGPDAQDGLSKGSLHSWNSYLPSRRANVLPGLKTLALSIAAPGPMGLMIPTLTLSSEAWATHSLMWMVAHQPPRYQASGKWSLCSHPFPSGMAVGRDALRGSAWGQAAEL